MRDLPETHFPSPAQIALQFVDASIARLTSLRRSVFVVIDGRGGAGKSALAAALAQHVGPWTSLSR